MSQRPEPLKINELVFVFSEQRNGRVAELTNYSRINIVIASQVAKIKFSDRPGDHVIVHYHRDGKELNVERIRRIGQPRR